MLAVVLPFDVLQFVDRDDHVVAVVGEYKAVLQCMPFLQHDECIFLLHADFCNGACIEAPHAGPFDVAVPCHRDHDFLFSDENFFLKFYRLYFILYDTPPRGGIFLRMSLSSFLITASSFFSLPSISLSWLIVYSSSLCSVSSSTISVFVSLYNWSMTMASAWASVKSNASTRLSLAFRLFSDSRITRITSSSMDSAFISPSMMCIRFSASSSSYSERLRITSF